MAYSWSVEHYPDTPMSGRIADYKIVEVPKEEESEPEEDE